MTKLPWLQFYTSDWESDSVAGCSLAAQGLWLRMMCIAHRSERYGYLVQNGSPIPPGSIARRCGCTLEQYDSLLSELLSAGVPSTLADGTLYSRRMVKDDSTRTANRNRKSRSRSQQCHADVTPMSQGEVRSQKLEVRSQKSEEVKTNTAPDGAPGIVPLEVWFGFVEMRRKIRKPLTNHATDLIRQKLQVFKDAGEDPIEILEQSIMNSWAGVFSLKKRGEVYGQRGKSTTSEVVRSFLKQINAN